MEKWKVFLSILPGLILFSGAVFLRVNFGEEYELKSLGLILPFIIILLANGKFFGIFGVPDIEVHFRNDSSAYDQFSSWLNQSDEDAQNNLSKLPGFTGSNQAVPQELSKRDVFKTTDGLHT